MSKASQHRTKTISAQPLPIQSTTKSKKEINMDMHPPLVGTAFINPETMQNMEPEEPETTDKQLVRTLKGLEPFVFPAIALVSLLVSVLCTYLAQPDAEAPIHQYKYVFEAQTASLFLLLFVVFGCIAFVGYHADFPVTAIVFVVVSIVLGGTLVPALHNIPTVRRMLRENLPTVSRNPNCTAFNTFGGYQAGTPSGLVGIVAACSICTMCIYLFGLLQSQVGRVEKIVKLLLAGFGSLGVTFVMVGVRMVAHCNTEKQGLVGGVSGMLFGAILGFVYFLSYEFFPKTT
jgi:uncharacterized membrane protein